MSSRKHKILLIGSDGFNASNESAVVACVPWKAIDSSLNLRDFDTIVLNLLARENEPFDAMKLSAFCSIVNFSVTTDVLDNQGKIIVLGDPRFTVKRKEDKVFQEPKESEVPFLYWTGLNFRWEDSRTPDIALALFHNLRAFFVNRSSPRLEPKTVRFFELCYRVARYGYPY